MIVAIDSTIPYWREAFAGVGELRPFSGRHIHPRDLEGVDALVVRSITPVNADLLDGSDIRFVGIASVGKDNLDERYLTARGIRYANAQGSNAVAVAEYIVAVLLVLAERKGWDLSQKSIAIIGVGNVGSRVELMARALGMEVHLCDPPLRESTGQTGYRFLDDVLGADILTLHVPLTTEGAYPTLHMMDRDVLARLSPRQFLINSARGAVVRGGELKRVLRMGKLEGAVLDVWEGEPRVDYELLELLEIGTPHIAGFSLDGKVRGTEMILEALCEFFGLAVTWSGCALLPPPRRIRPAPGAHGLGAVRSLVRRAYDVARDDACLRSLIDLPEEQAAVRFDRLRDRYPLRPEFRHYTPELSNDDRELSGILRGLGFRTTETEGGGLRRMARS